MSVTVHPYQGRVVIPTGPLSRVDAWGGAWEAVERKTSRVDHAYGSKKGIRLTLSSRPYSPLYRADRDLPSATSIKPTTAFRAAIGTARLAYIMRVTSELLVVARAACGLCLKDTCMDERDDCERVGADLQ
jgi:hypothetical protein